MARMWTAISVRVAATASDVIANLMLELGAPGLIIEDEAEMERITGHFLDASPTREIQRFCDSIGVPVTLTQEMVREDDWAENWKQHFSPLAIGERLWVTPPWGAAAPEGRIEIVIEPGMAFGTGHHATTAGCLELIDWALADRPFERALDLGCGSGILAIALAKLGVKHILAVDTDTGVCQIAHDNIVNNGVQDRVRVSSIWTSGSGYFDLIVANLYAGLLKELAARLAGALAPNGLLICSGFLAADAGTVHDTFSSHGLALTRRWEDGDWTALSLQTRTPV